MKQYYIKEINLNKININNIKLPYKKYKQKVILTHYGYYLFKNDFLIKNFINNYTLYYNDVNHSKCKFSNHINNENKFIEKNIYEFKQSEFSKTKIVIEIIDNNIIDLYFVSSFSIDDLFLKEDIKILVQLLKC